MDSLEKPHKSILQNMALDFLLLLLYLIYATCMFKPTSNTLLYGLIFLLLYELSFVCLCVWFLYPLSSV